MVFGLQQCGDGRHFLDAFFKARDFFFWHLARPGARNHQPPWPCLHPKGHWVNCRWCLLAFRQIKGQVFSDFTGHKRGHGVIRISQYHSQWWPGILRFRQMVPPGLHQLPSSWYHSRILHVAFNISLGICHGDDGSEWASPKDFDRNFSISFLVCCQDLTGNEGAPSATVELAYDVFLGLFVRFLYV